MTTLLCLLASGVPAWSGDEAATVVVVARAGDELWAVLASDPAIAPYYLLQDAWSSLSTSPAWMRLPSALAMGSAVGMLFALVDLVLGRRTAWLAAIAFALMPAVSRYGQEARPYAAAVAAIVAFVLLWWCHLTTGRARSGWGAVAALVAAGLLHAYSLLVVGALLLAVALVPVVERRHDVVRTLRIGGVAALVLAAFLLLLGQRAMGQPNPTPASLPGLAEELARMPLGRLGLPLAPLLALAILVLAAVGVVGAILRLRGRQRALAAVVGVWAAAPPLALTTFQLLTDRPGVVARYWLICLPALAIGIALALARLPGRVLPATVLLVLAAAGLPTQVGVRGPDGHLGERWAVLPEALEVPGLEDVGLLIRGYSERGLAANDSVAADVRTPLNGDAAAAGTLSPSQARPGSAEFEALLRDSDVVLVYQALDGEQLRPVARLGQPDELLEAFPEPLVVCRWFQDELVLLAKPGVGTEPSPQAIAASLEALAPHGVACRAG